MAKILVIGDDLRSFLAVVRSLGKAGHLVHALADSFGSPALKSRYINRLHKCAPLFASPQAWLDRVADLDAREDFDWIFPCTDQALLPLMVKKKLKNKLDQSKILSPGQPAFDLFIDKIKTHKLAEKAGVSMASWTPVDAIGGSFPQFLKPRSSISLTHLARKRVVEKFDSAKALLAHLGEHEKQAGSDYFLEQGFDGEGCGISVLADQGAITAAFQHGRLAEGASGGSSLRRAEALDPDMLAAAAKIVAAAKLNGLAMVEFRRAVNGSDFILVEVNARVWGSLPLAIFAGIDFPALLIQQATRQKNKREQDPVKAIIDSNINDLPAYKIGRTGRALTPSIYDFRRLLSEKSGLGKLGFMVKSAFKAVGLMIIGWQAIDSFDWRDWRPFWGELWDQITMVCTKIGKVTGVLPWVRGITSLRRLSKHRGEVKNILTLCYGNICRSPFMADCLRDEFSDSPVTIVSAGFHMPEGRKSPKKAQAAASKEGYDLAKHRSQFVTHDMVKAADVILYFDERNERDIANFFPEAQSKSFNAGQFLTQKTDIADPFGGSKKAYKKCYRQIAISAQVIADLLVGGDRHDAD